jgi:hypothetical protein
MISRCRCPAGKRAQRNGRDRVAHELGAPIDVSRKAIAGFGGFRRRFPALANGMASPSMTTMATIRSKSRGLESRPRATEGKV